MAHSSDFLDGVTPNPPDLPTLPLKDDFTIEEITGAFKQNPVTFAEWVKAALHAKHTLEVGNAEVISIAHRLTEESQNLREYQLEQENHVLTLQKQVTDLTGQNGILHHQITTATAAAHGGTSKKHPDPEMYDGTAEKLLEFIKQMRLKLSANSDWFLNDRT